MTLPRSPRTADPAAAGSARAAESPELPAVTRLVDLADAANKERLVAVLRVWVGGRRWFRSKARQVRAVYLVDVVPLSARGPETALFVLELRYTEGEAEEYAVPLARLAGGDAEQLGDSRAAVVASLGPDGDRLVDAMLIPGTTERLLAAIGARRRRRGTYGTLAARPTGAYGSLRGDPAERLVASPSQTEQSNTSVVLGGRLILKLYRRLEAGLNPDLEVGTFLTDRGFPHVPAVAGSLEYRRGNAGPATLAILQAYRENLGDAWSYTLDVLGRYLDAAVARTDAPPAVETTAEGLLALAAAPPPRGMRDAIGGFLDEARLLGERTAALHLALGSERDDPAFAPEPADARYARSIRRAVRSAARHGFDLLERRSATLPDRVRTDAEVALALRSRADATLARLVGRGHDGQRIRIHGDYHLGQVLHTGRDFVIIDFEGEPGRPMSERRIKRSPLVDVAGMLRSFSYAASGSLVRRERVSALRGEDLVDLVPWVDAWTAWVSAAFLAGYRAVAGRADILPPDDAGWAILLDAFLLEKALYELDYELNNRPDWVGIPLRGIVGLLAGRAEAGA